MIVGLTGGIGSGKTYVAGLFEAMGVPIYIADTEAKKLMNSNSAVKKSIIDLFGVEAYQNDVLNKKFIADQVFENKLLLNDLNAIVHPAVAAHFQDWYNSQKFDFVIKESAILFETEGYKKCDKTILVIAPENIRIKRVMKRDQISEAQVRARINNQWSDERKKKLADYVVNNIDKFYVKKKVNELFLAFKRDFI
ncbi:dephospho-CoA kinase [Aquimarina agarivorans]|uniref:dephospho-CoA kinase n=1 Tax=Aquimarina agarivorans TaxID=980584 RepID=UPI000248EB3D|nr:dephospho-CoA kinase [Aquimarina agarivorans]